MANDSRKKFPNLRPIKPGEVRNPAGRNGKTQVSGLRNYLDEKAAPTSRQTRRENLLLALYTTAIDRRHRDHVAATKTLMAYDMGLPSQAVEVSGEMDMFQGPNPLEEQLNRMIQREREREDSEK